MQVTVTLTPESQKILAMAIRGEDKTPEQYLNVQLEKYFRQQEVVIAKSRLNLHKRTVAHAIHSGVFANLQQAYDKLGMSAEVKIFGGIDKVYSEIFLKTGNFIPKDKIRAQGTVVAINSDGSEVSVINGAASDSEDEEIPV